MKDLNKQFMEKFWKIYSEKQMEELWDMKPYPRNEEICEWIRNIKL